MPLFPADTGHLASQPRLSPATVTLAGTGYVGGWEPAPLSELVDTFDGPDYEAWWTVVSAGSAITAGRSRQVINSSFDGELSTGLTYDFLDVSAKVEVEVDTTGDNRDVYFHIGKASDNRAVIELAASTLSFVAGGSSASVTYDPVAHRWWRIWEYSDNLVFSTSPDGEMPWTTQRTVLGHGMDLTDVRYLLGAGRNTGVGGPFYAYFDNLNSS